MKRQPPVSANDSESRELSGFGRTLQQRSSASPKGMVSSQHYLASRAGAEMLERGGNAVDAAVATAFALCVCEPAASGLGGQTMMIVHLAEAERTFVLDGSSFAPHRVVPGSLTAYQRKRGYLAATVPTTPRTLEYALKKYGRLPLAEVMQPAVNLAEKGYPVSELQRALTRRERHALRTHSGGSFFLKEGRKSYRVGEIFHQPVLANTLRQLVDKGVDDFYTGEIAQLIHKDMERNGGLIRLDDLAQVQGPIERKAVRGRFKNWRIRTMPPPGAGRVLLEMLNVAAEFKRAERNPNTPEGAVLLAKIMRQAHRDRRDRPYDPQFYPQVTEKHMTSRTYAAAAAAAIRSQGETTHLSVMDADGNVVGLTQSIERVYGSCCAAEELGFLYNNYMMAFEYDDISHPHYLRPRAVPWASVAPTIVFKDKSPRLVIGSPGSQRITSSIFQVLLRLQYNSPLDAVDAPRLHCDHGNKVSLEADRMSDSIIDALTAAGFEIDRRDPYSFYLGCISLVVREGDDFTGVADPRRDGAAFGPQG